MTEYTGAPTTAGIGVAVLALIVLGEPGLRAATRLRTRWRDWRGQW